MKDFFVCFSAFMITTFAVFGRHKDRDTTVRKCFIGSTFFMLGNFSSTNKPDFVQLNLGKRVTSKDAVSIEIKTWKYAWPLGIPYGQSFEAPEEKFPGYIREYGIAFAYQRFWWKGLYTAIHIMNARQTFLMKQALNSKTAIKCLLLTAWAIN